MVAAPAFTYAGLRAFLSGRASNLARSARELRKHLRLRPFDLGTSEGRSAERYRRAALTTVVSIGSRTIGIFTGLAWIRLSLSYLGRERYGLWMSVGSLIAWANLADLGLARGMQNHLSHANGKDDRDEAARYVSTGFVTLGVIAASLALICCPIVLLVPWSRVLNVSNPELAGETRAVLAAVLTCFLLDFPLSVVPTMYSAYQRGYVSAIFNVMGSVLSLGALVIAMRLHLDLPWMILATSGSYVVTTSLSFAYAMRTMPWIRPRLRLASLSTLRRLAGTSSSLLVFQISGLLVSETQSLIIARRLGLSQVADWSILMRVYLLPAALIGMIDSPLIPAFREAHVRGENHWLRTAFWRVTKLKLWICGAAAVLMVAFGNSAASLLGAQTFAFAPELWGACAFLLLVTVWNGSFNDLMISVDRLRLLVIIVSVNGLITPTLSYFLAPHFGLLGIVMATPVFSLIVSAWLLPWASRDLVSRRAGWPSG